MKLSLCDQAAKKYAKQFGQGRPYDSIPAYARQDFKSGWEAALAQQAQPLTDEMIEAETQRLVDGHFVNAFIDRQVMVSLAKWARGFAVSQPTQIVHCRECSMVDCPGPTETD